jgi:hypothetical protein
LGEKEFEECDVFEVTCAGLEKLTVLMAGLAILLLATVGVPTVLNPCLKVPKLDSVRTVLGNELTKRLLREL